MQSIQIIKEIKPTPPPMLPDAEFRAKRREQIRESLKMKTVTYLTIDPYGRCNVGCWYCPVRYEKAPEKAAIHMHPDTFEKIFSEARSLINQGRVFDAHILVYLTHFSDIFLYRHLEELLKLLRKYQFITDLLTNGVAMSRKKVDLICEYSDVVRAIMPNIVSFDAEQWSKYTNSTIKNFHTMVANLDYLHEKKTENITIAYNYALLSEHNSESFSMNHLSIGDNAPVGYQNLLQEGLVQQQVGEIKKRWPKFGVSDMPICDRSGFLADRNIISQEETIAKIKQQQNGEFVLGCKNSPNDGEHGGQFYNFIHVAANADVFVCCNDYQISYVVGNLKNDKIEDLWGSEKHIEVIEQVMDGFCSRCYLAKWGK